MPTLFIDTSLGAQEFIPTSFYTGEDSGLDLHCLESITIEPGSVLLVGMGIRCRMEDDSGRPLAYYLYGRSSIAKTPLMLANGVGIIDRSYRGEIKAAFRNLSSEPYVIEKGTRLVQICTADLSPFYIIYGEVRVDETERGAGGFGSTGK
jgi:dUTP pyrophosphatase